MIFIIIFIVNITIIINYNGNCWNLRVINYKV